MNFSIGTDIEEIKRFENKTLENDEHFLHHVFTENELNYSFSKGKPAQHLCARFCAKEATIKALTDIGINDINYIDIEIQNKDSKVPFITIKKYPELNIKVSLSHCKTHACAMVLYVEE